MRNKSGDITTEEVLKLVLAIAGILILLMLGYSLYKIFVQKTEIAQAKEHLDAIQGVVENLGLGNQTTYLLTGPKGWYFVSYNRRDLAKYSDLSMPAMCKDQSCLCICSKDGVNDPSYIVINDDRSENIARYAFYFDSEKAPSTPTRNTILGTKSYWGLEDCQSKGVCFSTKEDIVVDSGQWMKTGVQLYLLPLIPTGDALAYFPWMVIGAGDKPSLDISIEHNKDGRFSIRYLSS